jgi:hypothetical protein
VKITLIHFILVITSCIISAKESSAYNEPGGLSHLLNYRFAMHPARSEKDTYVVAKVTNVSGRDIRLGLPSEDPFSIRLTVISTTGRKYRAFDKDYLALLRVGTPIYIQRIVKLAANDSIRWEIPMRRFRTTGGERITLESLAGAVIISELSMAVVPPSGRYVTSNARQKSKPIKIPTKRLTSRDWTTGHKPFNLIARSPFHRWPVPAL